MIISQADFQAWTERHHEHLAEYTAFEVAQLALAAGFTLSDIAPDTSEWVTASKRRLRLWESPFFAKWLNVTLTQNGQDDL